MILTNVDEIKLAAMQLAPVDREQLAEALLQSINDQEQEELDNRWLEEVRRRDAKPLLPGTNASSVDEVIFRLERKLGK